MIWYISLAVTIGEDHDGSKNFSFYFQEETKSFDGDKPTPTKDSQTYQLNFILKYINISYGWWDKCVEHTQQNNLCRIPTEFWGFPFKQLEIIAPNIN